MRTGSDFTQNAVDNPIDRSGAHAIACADSLVLQVLDNELDERKLNKRRIVDAHLLTTVLGVEYDGVVRKNGETQGTAVADDFDAVFLGRFVGHKAPGAGARKPILTVSSVA